MSEGAGENPGKRLVAAANRFNRNPKLVEAARRARERALGGGDHIDHLSTARGRPSDLAARRQGRAAGNGRPSLAEADQSGSPSMRSSSWSWRSITKSASSPASESPSGFIPR